jgi:hypothetical protein
MLFGEKVCARRVDRPGLRNLVLNEKGPKISKIPAP